LDQEPLFRNEENINNLGDFEYQGIVDTIMAKLKKKYNLRPRNKKFTIDPPKKILSRNKTNEVA
jgi:hypothetical protein